MTTAHTNAPKIATAILGALFLLSPAWSTRLNPMAYEGGRSRDVVERDRRNSSAVAALIGDLRTNMADIMFIKTERYLHSGVAYTAHLTEADLKNAGSIDKETAKVDDAAAEFASDDHEGHDHGEDAGTPTIIPNAGADYRGIVGTLQRQVKPWKDPSEGHTHTDGTELLPWYRVMTLADPHNVRGYAIGAWWLKSRNRPEAVRFLNEGIERNPESFQLPYVLAQVLQLDLNDAQRVKGEHDPQVKALRSQIKDLFRKSAELGLAKRPKDWTPEKSSLEWTHYTDDDVRGAARLAVITEGQWGDLAKSIEMAREYLKTVPDDGILVRYLVRQGAASPSGPPSP